MSKNFLNLLATSVIVLSCGTAINCSSCYCMEDSIESTMDETNNISTNISQQDDSFNTINETRPNHNLQIHNIPVQNTFDSKELIATTEELFNNKQYYNKNDVRKEIKNYIRNIKEFYKSNNINTFNQLTKLVFTAHGNFFHGNCTALCKNVKELQRRNSIKRNATEEILVFNLLIHIMTDIEYSSDNIVYINDIKEEYLKSTDYYYDTFYGNCTDEVLIARQLKSSKYKDCVISEGSRYNLMKLRQEIKDLIAKLTELLIPQYFVLDKLETWITREELESEIKYYIQSMCKYFDSLPIIKQILNNKNIKSTYDEIPEDVINSAIYGAIYDFFYYSEEVKDTLTREYKKSMNAYREYQASQGNELLKAFFKSNNINSQIKSKYIRQNIFDYVGKQKFNGLVKYKKVPNGRRAVSSKILYIVNSYLNLDNNKRHIIKQY